MMEALVARGRDLGAARADAVRVEVAAVLAAEVAGLDVSIDGDAVVAAGPALRWRAVRAPALRWIGRMLR